MKNFFFSSIILVLASSTVQGADDSAEHRSVLPPDYFKVPNQAEEKYLFPTSLETTCKNSKGLSYFCPNVGTGDTAGWVMARYKSRHAGGFDAGTASLLMVYIPPGSPVNGVADNVHRWLNFALPHTADDNPPMVPAQTRTEYVDMGPWDKVVSPTPLSPIPEVYTASMPGTFTMVSVTEGSPAKVHFQKFYRREENSFYTPESSKGIDPVDCYGCHPNGLRAISPLGYHLNDAELSNSRMMLDEATWRNVQKINQAMERVEGGTTVLWDNFDPKAGVTTRLGRSLDAAAPTRTKKFIMGTSSAEECEASNIVAAARGVPRDCGCARIVDTYDITDIFGRAPGLKNVYTLNRKAPINYEKIRDAMDCEQCHNDTGRGSINSDIGENQINFKLLVDRSMPFGAHNNPLDPGGYSDSLDIDHRIALASCLRKELETMDAR